MESDVISLTQRDGPAPPPLVIPVNVVGAGADGASRSDVTDLRGLVEQKMREMEVQAAERDKRHSAELQKGLREIREAQARAFADLARAISSSLAGGGSSLGGSFGAMSGTRTSTCEDKQQDGVPSGGDKMAPVRVRRKKTERPSTFATSLTRGSGVFGSGSGLAAAAAAARAAAARCSEPLTAAAPEAAPTAAPFAAAAPEAAALSNSSNLSA